MGSGVKDNETFENLIEDEITKQKLWKNFDKVEILNFSIGYLFLPEQVGIVEQRILPFDPDILFYCVHSVEWERNISSFARILAKPHVNDYPLFERNS